MELNYIVFSVTRVYIYTMNTTSKFNDALEFIETFSIDEQEEILEIVEKRLRDKKRKILIENIAEAEKDFENGNYITGTPEELIKAIEEEANKLK